MISKRYLTLTCNSMCSVLQKAILPICFPEPSDTVPTSLLSQPRGCLHRCSQKCRPQKQWEIPLELGGLTLACSGRGAVQQERAQGPCSPWHGPALAADTSVLQLVHSQDLGKLLPKDRQSLLFSCHKNVTRKQPHTPSPVIFSSHLSSSISESLLQKALLKALSLPLAN